MGALVGCSSWANSGSKRVGPIVGAREDEGWIVAQVEMKEIFSFSGLNLDWNFREILSEVLMEKFAEIFGGFKEIFVELMTRRDTGGSLVTFHKPGHIWSRLGDTGVHAHATLCLRPLTRCKTLSGLSLGGSFSHLTAAQGRKVLDKILEKSSDSSKIEKPCSHPQDPPETSYHEEGQNTYTPSRQTLMIEDIPKTSTSQDTDRASASVMNP
ncbi:hypothetical protein U9M48_040279 [Paspalum notatum var. saurae]|uniref:Uncharacterized protein n=1 Tax=Paspalum notatum var. saurae TaxID=547442 RepID=A0AAQ3ULF9_PASNO